MRLIHSFIIAFSTYSKIPMPHAQWSEENKKYSMCFFPLIGAAVGLALVLWLWICERLGLQGFLRGAIGALIPLLVTGGIHMDGFMDTMDAMASWQTRERRLEILKDSHTGAFAVIGCTAYLLIAAGVMCELKLQQCFAAGAVFVLSRSLSALALTYLPKAKNTGILSGFAKAGEKRAVSIACGLYVLICAVILIFSIDWLGMAVLLVAGGCFAYYRHLALKHFGGVTGDLAGWFVQVTELVCLLVIALGGKIV